MSRAARRWWWIVALAVAAAGTARLRFDVDVLNLLPDDVPAVQGLKLYDGHFANARELIVTVGAASASEAEGAARAIALRLRAMTNLVGDATWQPPWLERPGDAAELAAHMWLNQSPEVFRQRMERLSPSNAPATLAAARDRLATSFSPAEIGRLAYDPFGFLELPAAPGGAGVSFGEGREFFESADGTFRLVYVESRENLRTYRDCAAWLAAVRREVATARPLENAPARVAFTGRPAFVAEIAGGMERDITASVLGTAVVIGCLFWWAHRRWRPLLWLIALLGLILAGTTALGGLFFGAINVVSLGFAAILLGLAVDYGLVLYQEARSAPDRDAAAIRREHGAGIFWSAMTTAGAFALLNLGGFPGLAQLGSLVALGVGLAAVVMLFLYLPPLLRSKGTARVEEREPFHAAPGDGRIRSAILPWLVTIAVAGAASWTLWRTPPIFDHSPAPLRPLQSAAHAAVEEIKARMQREREPLWLIVSGSDEAAVAATLDAVRPVLQSAADAGVIRSFTLPDSLWPRPAHRESNLAAAASLADERGRLRGAMLAAGFTTNAFAVTDSVLDQWRNVAATPGSRWPSNAVSRWIHGRIAARTEAGWLALGLIHVPDGGAEYGKIKTLSAKLPDNARVAGWDTIGDALLEAVERRLWLVVGLMSVLLFGSLWLAFRSVAEVLLSLATLGFSLAALLGVMGVLGWSWNLLNLMALPLLLGSGVDYSIHMQLALRRHAGAARAARRSTGRALFLCGATTVTGFSSLAWSNNAGLASLGKVCAVGVAVTTLTAIFLLPAWWGFFARGVSAAIATGPGTKPSRLYQGALWGMAVRLSSVVPYGATTALCRFGVWLYAAFAARRRATLVGNLLPVLGGDREAAERCAWDLFDQFARKLADLWRYESGRSVDHLFGPLEGFERFIAARERGRGVLLVTPHLGNWEFGAPLLARHGVKLLVLTQSEPGAGFTEMRRDARARWGIETLVVGADPFAFVEVIKRLETGATVALLVDRPPPASAVEVGLFGRPFAASVAAAELARASGCALLPVVLPRTANGYGAFILPEIAFERRELGSREARQRLTQEILRAFEPVIRQHPDQWFHFVPLWRER